MSARGPGSWRQRRALRLAAARADSHGAARQQRRAQLRFLLAFAGVAGALFALYAYPYAEHGAGQRCFRAYLSAYARVAGGVLRVFDRGVGITGNVITGGRYSLQIVKTCDAMEANLLFLAAVAAFPAPWRRKLLAAGAGLAALVALNLARICSLYFIGIHLPRAFDVLHLEVWPLVLIAAATAQFAAWAAWLSPKPGAPAVPASR